MHWHLGPYQMALLLTAAWVTALAIVAARRPGVPGASALARLSLAVAGWAAGYAAELAATSIEAKLIWSCLTYAAIVTVPVAWLLFSLGYSGDWSWLSPRRQGLLFVVPSITVLLAWTNPAHGFMWTDLRLEPYGELLLMHVTHGPAFWLHAAYSYALTLAGIVIVARVAVGSHGLRRRQALVLLFASAAPILTNAGRLARLPYLGPLDPSAFAFAASASAFTWALIRLRFLDVLPVARDQIVQVMGDGVVVLDSEGQVLDANPAACRMLGLTTERLIGDALAAALPGSTAPTAYATGGDVNTEIALQADGTERLLEVRFSDIVQARDRVGRLVVMHDVTERRRQQQALAESEARYRSIVQSQTELICHLLPDGTLTFVNDAFCRHFGVSPDEAVGHGLDRYMSEQDRQFVGLALDALNPDQPDSTAEQRLELPDGQVRWLQMTARGIFDESGRVKHFQCVGRDVTARRRAEEALLQAHQELEQRVQERTAALARTNQALEAEAAEREQVAAKLRKSEERFRALFTASSDAIFVRTVTNDNLRQPFIEVNDVACQRLGYSRDELLTMTMADIDPLVRDSGLPNVVARLVASGYALYESRHVAKDGRSIPVEVNARLFELGGQPMLISIARDVSERYRLQEQVLRSQKMETLGRLAGGIAHDFNNLLTAIGGHAGFVSEQLPPGDPAHEDLDQVLRASERAANLTRQLLAFSSRQMIEPRPVHLNDIVLDTRKMLQRIIGEDVVLITRLEATDDLVLVDPGQIEQVLVNLAVNARDAMPEGGRLVVSTQEACPDDHGFDTPDGTAPGPCVCLAVTDTGVGMSDEVRNHIFEPFYTTKPTGKGTGLGLATVYGIIEQHEGSIHVRSQAGQGTTFSIYLPLRSGDAARPDNEATVRARVGGSETIFLVEDERGVREVAERVLRSVGYRVIAAGHAEEALSLARAEPGPIHLLLTDIVMPGTGGRELAAALMRDHPGLRVLFASGYTEDHAALQRALRPGVVLLHKPFTADALCSHVRRALDDDSPAAT